MLSDSVLNLGVGLIPSAIVVDAESKLGRCLEVACNDLYLEVTIFT